MQIPPWLDVTPGMFLGAAEAGESAGQRNRQLSDEELESLKRDQLSQQQMGMQSDEQAASLALKRDELGLQAQSQQAQQQQAMRQETAANALRQATMQQQAQQAQQDQALKAAQILQAGQTAQDRSNITAQLGQERVNTLADRAKTYAEQAATALKRAEDLKTYQDEITAVRQQIADTPKVNNAVTVKTATGDTIKMTKDEYSAYEQALKKWQSGAPAKTVSAWGGLSTKDNPAYAAYEGADQPQPQDFIGGGAAPAAAALQAPASTLPPAAPTPPTIPAAAIAALQANPDKADEFDAKYGDGMADTYIDTD